MFHNRSLGMFKVKNAWTPEIVKYVFIKLNENHYNLRNQGHFQWPLIRTVYHGSEFYLGPKTRDFIPEKWKEATPVDSFKKPVRKKIRETCPCRLSKAYVFFNYMTFYICWF